MKRMICLWMILALAFSTRVPAFSESADADPLPAAPALSSVQDGTMPEEEAKEQEELPAAEKIAPSEPVQEAEIAAAVPAAEESAAPAETAAVETAPEAEEPASPEEQDSPEPSDALNPAFPEEPATPEQPEPAAAEPPEPEASGSPDAPAELLPAETPDTPADAAEPSVEKGTADSPAAPEAAAAETETAAADEPAPVSELSKAANLQLSSRGLDAVTLTFDGDSAPTEYRVYRSTSKKGKYTCLGSAWELDEGRGNYRFEDLTVKKGTTYYYKVRGRITEAEETRWGAWSAVVSGSSRPASIGKLTGKSLSAVSVKVSWEAVPGATGYQIGRSTKLDSGYKTLKTTKGKAAAYTDKTAKMGNQYYYRVRAYYTAPGGAKIYGPYTYSSAVLCAPAPPANFTVSKVTENAVTLSWTPAAGVDYYNLTWSWKEGGQTKKETVEGIAPGRKSLQVTGLVPGQEVTFQIRSYGLTAKSDQMRSGIAECVFTLPLPEAESEGLSASKSALGAQSPENGLPAEADPQEQAEEEPLLPGEDEGPVLEKEALETAPVITGTEILSGGVLLSWSEAPGAETYRVERSAKQDSGYAAVAQGILETSFLDTTASAAKAYFYRVTALDGSGAELTGAPKGVFFSAALSLTAKRGSDGYYTLSWASRKNADQYRIFRSVNGGAFERVKTLKASAARSWKDPDISAGSTYAYYVQAWKTQDGEKLPGARGTEKSIYAGVKENPAVTVTQGPSRITLSWDKVENASGYVVYGAKGDGELAVLARVAASAASWSQKPPAASGTLKYYVRAYANVAGKKSYAPPSDPVVIRRLSPPQTAVRRGDEEDTLEVRWSEVEGAQGYRVAYRQSPEADYSFVETADRAAVLPVKGGSTASVYVQALCTEGGKTFVGSRSVIKSLTPYWKYALLIGNSQYTSKSSLGRLAMCAADVEGLSVVLDKQHGWNVNICANLTGSEILSAIPRFFNGANESCTCLFYYAGHGSISNDEKSGSMFGIDGSWATLGELKAALGRVPGKTVVLLDSCGSGAAVENDSGAATLAEDKYSVIAASKAYEKSFASLFYSYFTYYLSFGSGWDYNSQKDLSSLPADTDRDGTVTFRELCGYIARYLTVSTLTTKLPEPDAPIY